MKLRLEKYDRLFKDLPM
jgi:hypothetical protein